MLKVKSVRIYGFGPYIHQTLDFDDRNGVTIIWGDNGVGKTTFINALKFGFYGEIPNFGNEEKSIVNIVNQHNMDSGNYDVSVTIEFEIEDDDYSLTRYAKVKNNALKPEGLSDYDISLSLAKNSRVLAPQEAKSALNTIMPENTSRFFIFDGELLEEYTRLSENTQQSLKLKDSIEQILGLPILTKAKMHVDEYKKNVSNQLLDREKKSDKNKKIHDKISSLKEDLEDDEKEKEYYANELLEFENQFKEIAKERYKISDGAKLQEYDELKKSHEEIEQNISTLKSKIKELINEQWRGLILNRLITEKMRLKNITDKYEEYKSIFDSHKRTRDIYQISINKRACEVCQKKLNNEDIDLLNKKMSEIKSLDIPKENKEIYEKCKSSIMIIEKYEHNLSVTPETLKFYSNNLDDLIIQRSTIEIKMETLIKEIEDFDNQRNQNILLRDREKIVLENIVNAKESIETKNQKIKKHKEEITKLENKIKEDINDEELEIFKKKDKFLEDFSNLLDEGIDVFRSELKDRVEKDASDLFKKFSNQKEFVELKINENYGLDIVHKSGVIVPVKSSGFSHIVSLCLIGALHKNAPVQGPVFIDSPSGRLDEAHKNNLINILTEISNQVVLLLYHGELDEQNIRRNLGPSLLNEYNLEQEDAFDVRIIER